MLLILTLYQKIDKNIYKYDNGKWIGKVAYYELKGQWKESSDFSLSYFKCKQN